MGRSCEMGKLCDSFHWLHCNLKTCDITEHLRVHLLQTTESRQRRNGKQEGELACLLPLIYRWFFFPTVRTILTFGTTVTQAAANSHQITWTKRVCEHYISPVTGVHTSWERVFFGVAAITTYVFFCTGILKKKNRFWAEREDRQERGEKFHFALRERQNCLHCKLLHKFYIQPSSRRSGNLSYCQFVRHRGPHAQT